MRSNLELSPTMQEKHDHIRKSGKPVVYKKVDWRDGDEMKKIGCWVLEDTEFIRKKNGTMRPTWEIRGQTVKALARRGYLKPAEYAYSKWRDVHYPIKYELIGEHEGE